LQLGLSTFFEPAKTAAIPSIVEPRELVTANAISSVTWSAMLTLGAAIGGLITSTLGTDAAFILDAASYILSAVLIANIRVPKRPKRQRQKVSIGRLLGITETIDGIRYVKDRPRVLAALLVKPAWGLGGGILTLLAVFGERIFPMGKNAGGGIGVLFAARGIGTAIGPLVARRVSGEGAKGMQAAIGIAFLIGGTFYIAFGRATNFIFALVVLGIAHCGGSILWVFSTVILQKEVVDNFRGRVFAAELALVTLTMAASNYVTGELLTRFNISPRTVTVGIGILFLLPGITWFLTRRWWNRNVREAPSQMREQQVVQPSIGND
jgi:Major Facilitator Superfamily